MNLKLPLSAALASLLFAAPVLAADQTPAATGQTMPDRYEGHMRREHANLEERLNRAVEKGHLTRQQADGFLAEGRQLREEFQSQRQASGGKLSDTQREQFRARRQALREKVHAAIRANQGQRG